MAHHDRNVTIEAPKIYSPQFSAKVVRCDPKHANLYNVCLAINAECKRWYITQMEDFQQLRLYGQDKDLIYVDFWLNEDLEPLQINERISAKLQIKSREYQGKEYVNVIMYKNASMGVESRKAPVRPVIKPVRSPVKPQLKREETSKPPVKRQLKVN